MCNKKWEIIVEANALDGSQTFACEAKDEEEALAKFKSGLCEIIEVNIEVIGLNDIPMDIEESDCIKSRLPNDLNAELTEENKQLRDALKVLIRSGEQLLNVEDIEDEEDAATIHSNFSDELVKADNLLNK